MKRKIVFIAVLFISIHTYSQRGLQWLNLHGDDAQDHPERVLDIHTDQWGNVYVGGEVNTIWVRDSNGQTMKMQSSPLLDSLHNNGKRDAWIAKYSPQGNLQWHRYAGSGTDDYYNAMIGDENGNLYVAGQVFYDNVRPAKSFGKVPLGSDQRGDFIAMVDSGGNLIWHRSFGGDTVGNGYIEYSVEIYGVQLKNNVISCFFRGGGDHGIFGYQKLFDKDSLPRTIHEALFDLHGNYLGVKTFPFPDQNYRPDIEKIFKHDNGYVIAGNLIRDTTLVGGDTLLLGSNANNAMLMFFDSSLNYIRTFRGNNNFDQFRGAALFGDTLVAAGNFNIYDRLTLTFDTISHTGKKGEFNAGGIFVFSATNGKLLGLYPTKSRGNFTDLRVSSVGINQDFMAAGGVFDQEMTLSTLFSTGRAILLPKTLFFPLVIVGKVPWPSTSTTVWLTSAA